MPIEIKELVVKFTVSEKNEQIGQVHASELDEDFAKTLVDRCVQEVLEKIEKYQER